jgi:uncharacterized protein YukE
MVSMYIIVPKLVPKTFTPPEAYVIAKEFRRAADHARTLAGELSSGGTMLEPTWDGTSKRLFFTMFYKRPTELLSIAEWFLNRANYIESIKVTIWEEVEELIPINNS